MTFESFILIGGKSSRMGEDKFSLCLNGKTFLEIAAETLQNFGDVTVVVSESFALANGLNVVQDIYKNRGALSGIHSALVHSKSDWTIILACDYPFVTVELIGFLTKFAQTEGVFDAFAPIQADGKIQPLCAIYKTETCRKVLTEMLENEGENYSVRDFLNQVKTRYLEFEQIAKLPNSEHFFFNVNTPEDFISAQNLQESYTKNSPVEILKMTPNDVGRVLEIQLACGLEGWSGKDYESETLRTDSFNVIAKAGGETVGYLVGRFIQSERLAELFNIGVEPRFRRKSVGEAMLKEFIGFCDSEKVEKLYLEVRNSNETAIQFYLKNDFAIIGKRKNFYNNPIEDAILMSKNL